VAPEFVINKARKAPLMKGIQLEIVDEAIDAVRCTPRDNKEIRRRLGIADDKVVIGCVAPFRQFGGSKGADYFLELAKRMEGDSRLVFLHVGYNMDTALCPSNYIPIAFVADQQELPDYYSVADLLVHPSLQDTMPSTCLEALACGTPLLCFNISGMPYIGDETVMTLVETKNVDQMVDVVKSTEKKTEKIINTCRNYALNRYDERKYAEKLLSLMESIQ
jgi:glycosyltransferase involved in cell wall biosynthesis